MDLIKFLKNGYYKIYTQYLRYKVKRDCKKTIKRKVDKNILNKQQEKEIKNYFKKYKKINTKFHEFYTKKTGNFFINYLPDDFYYCYIDMYYNNWNVAKIIDNKCFYNRLLPNLKQPDACSYRINNIWYNKNMIPVSFDKVKKNIEKENEIFIKEAYGSAGGKGVTYLKKRKNIISDFVKCVNNIKSDIIIQKAIKQNKVMASLNESSVNTVRILSMLKKDGTVKIYSSILRMGVNNAKVDNASSGGITCGIMEDGTLKNVAYKANGEKYFKHPTSNIKFNNIRIPKYNDMKELVIKNHPLIPMSRLISWDLALNDKDEIILIEVNLAYGELDFHQLNNGPIFGDDTQKILEEVFQNK